MKTIAKTTTMNLRLDTKTRQALQRFADDLGMPATTLVTATIKQMLRSGEARFTTTLEPTAYLEEVLQEVEADIKAGKKFAGPFDNADAMLAALKK